MASHTYCYQALAAEIDRVTGSPYPSQLRTLRDIVSQCSDAEISQWAAANPCLIDNLVSCLVEGLQQWSYVLDIVTKFASNAACRDAFLRQEPTLLHRVVAQAVKTPDLRSKCIRASVALLSLPLPDTVALPAEAQTLFIHLVEHAARNPSAATIEPVYFILHGTGGLLLGVLTTEVLARLEEQLLDILKNVSGTPHQCLSLYCLSIMNIVCSSVDPEFRLTNSSYNTQDFLASTPVSSRWKSEAMQQFFTGNKAQRSMQLVVLLVITATKMSTNDSNGDRLKSLVLANEIVAAIPADLRKMWCSANPVMIRKLQERLCAEDLDEVPKTLALRFLGKLCELDCLPHPVLESLELTFLESKSIQTMHTLCPHVDDTELFSGLLSRAPISLLLRNAVDYAIRADSAALATGIEAMTRKVASAQFIIGSQKITVHQIREFLQDDAFIEKLQKLQSLLQQPSHGFPQGHDGCCHSALHRMRCKLAHQLSNLLLRASQNSSLGPQAMTILLELHASSARGNLQCSHERTSWREIVGFGELEGGDSSHDQIDWREALQTHFKARAQVEQDAVTRLFTKACADLEARCESVEKPLRGEQQRREQLQEQNDELTLAFADLESRHIDVTVRNRSLEENLEIDRGELRDTREENSKLLGRITQLEKKLREAQAAGEKQLAELNLAKQMGDLDAAAKIAEKQEQLEDAQEALVEWKTKCEEQTTKAWELKNDLENASSERDRASDEVASRSDRVRELERIVGKLESDAEHLKTKNDQLEEHLRSASSSDADNLQQLSELRTELQACQSEKDQLKTDLDQETQALQSELENKQQEVALLHGQLRETTTDLQQQLETLQSELQATKQSLTSDVETRDTKIADLKKRVERCQRKCEDKDRQIAEAEAMRANLMSAMGISNTQSRTSLPHRSRESTAPQPDTQMTEQSPPTPTSGGNVYIENPELDQSFASNASSQESKSGPTPKRPRPRKSLSFAAPLTTKSRPSTTTSRMSRQSTTAVRQSVGRSALRSVSGNRPSFKPFKTPTKEVKNADVNGDDSTFDGSELFSGTQERQLVDLRTAFDEES